MAVVSTLSMTRAADVERRLYVATPGIRNYLEYGGHGLLVYDVDHGHKLIKRIKTAGLDEKGVPRNVKGICANAQTGRVYISTTHQMMCLDLETEKLLWEKAYPVGCDRMSMTPDGKTIYLPSFEGPIWYVVNAEDGEVITTVEPKSGAHNTVMGQNGQEVYLAGLRSPLLSVVDTRKKEIVRKAGPFSSEHPAVHREWEADTGVRECERAAGVRDWRPEDGEGAGGGGCARLRKGGGEAARVPESWDRDDAG